ncbi:unnamed protein product [Mytilus edulis]|uniref:Uncharacterized protein n=1 Tax=Mytilus edulis TaxID=6550 RepID=A0A8S3VS64_MYTED|nr:unnamed protein product [Mytilus edulis]
MRGGFDESRNPLDGKSTEDLDQLVCQLTNPSLNVTGKSHSLDILSIPSERELTRSPTELSTDIKYKCSLSPESPKDKKSAKKNWRKRILERKKCQGKIGSCDIDESVELSFDKDTRDVKDMSFDSTSSRSSSGLKSTQVSFNCDSSLDASDLDQQPEARQPFLKKIDDSVDTEQQSEMKAVNMNKKDKESKRQRLKRIITRPLRRSQSACCENEIPSHALFLDSKGSKSKDTMESFLLLYPRLFGEQEDKTKRFHKTFSAESALTEKEELLNNNSK